MEEIGKAFKAIFDKLSDFFDIFDFSFFISGFFTSFAIFIWLEYRNIYHFNHELKPIIIITSSLICYINGLFSFAIGKWIRKIFVTNREDKKIQKKENNNNVSSFDFKLKKIIETHGLNNQQTVQEYLNKIEEKGPWRLYIKYWAKIRQEERYSKSLPLIKRYWVNVATYDGLSVSVLVSILLLIETKFGIIMNAQQIPWITFISLQIILIAILLICVREAKRFNNYQMEEVIATIASGLD